MSRGILRREQYPYANIRKSRKFRGWTREELARRTGFTKYQIGRFEARSGTITLKELFKLAKAFKCSPRNLIRDG